MSIDTRSSNYDTGRGEQIAINADGVGSSLKTGEESVFPRLVVICHVMEQSL